MVANMKWMESEASKGRWEKWIGPMFNTWSVVWDNSSPNVTEFLVTKDGKFAYLKHDTRGSDTMFNSMSDDEKSKFIAAEVELLDDTLDLKSFVISSNNKELQRYMEENKNRF